VNYGLKKYVLTLLAVLAFVLNVSAQEVQWVSSAEQQPWELHSVLQMEMVKQTSAGEDTIQIYPDKKLQRIDGLGGCFNELGWEALLSLSSDERKQVLRQLFSPQGANFTICRVPIGASDYALSYYSYDDVPDDFAMENFSIARDCYILIPYIKAAKEIQPDLKLWGSPWSPPIWMKVNNHYALRTGPTNSPSSNLPPEKNIRNNATAFKMENGYLEAYALYLSKYVQAYQKEGLEISEIHVQNEIVYAPYWPSCTWQPEDLAWFIGKFLGPRFEQDDLKTEIWLGTINNPDPNYVRTILNNKDAATYIKGIGMQWAAKKIVGTIHGEYPNYPIMQTESECGNGDKSWKSAEYTWSLIQQYISNGANAYEYWNMVLDSSGKSSWGWAQNMLISVNKETKEIIYTPEFYLMKHLSHFVLPGARQIQTSGGTDYLAFVNLDGTVVLIVVNLEDTPRIVTVGVGDRRFELPMKAKTFNTLTWKP
jgi:glucosylceramidase